MEELLKQIAKLDGFDLQIYAPSEKLRKPKKNEIKNLTENRKTKKIKFTEISQNFTTLCETDFYLSSLKEENVVEVIEENDEGTIININIKLIIMYIIHNTQYTQYTIYTIYLHLKKMKMKTLNSIHQN